MIFIASYVTSMAFYQEKNLDEREAKGRYVFETMHIRSYQPINVLCILCIDRVTGNVHLRGLGHLIIYSHGQGWQT